MEIQGYKQCALQCGNVTAISLAWSQEAILQREDGERTKFMKLIHACGTRTTQCISQILP